MITIYALAYIAVCLALGVALGEGLYRAIVYRAHHHGPSA